VMVGGMLDGRDVGRISRTVLGPEARGRPPEGAAGLLMTGGLVFLVVAGGLVMSRQLDSAVAEADRRRAAGEAEDEGLSPEALIAEELRTQAREPGDTKRAPRRPIMPLAVGLTSLMSGQVRGFNIQAAEANMRRRGRPAEEATRGVGEGEGAEGAEWTGPDGLPPL